MKFGFLIFGLLIQSVSAYSSEVYCSNYQGRAKLERNENSHIILNLTKNGHDYRLDGGPYPTLIVEGQRELERVNYRSVKDLIGDSKIISGDGFSFFGTSSSVNAHLKVMYYKTSSGKQVMVISNDSTLIFSGTREKCL